MNNLTRREIVAAAALLGATAAMAGSPKPSRTGWVEKRDRFREGVASGDPGPDHVIVWTRFQPQAGERAVILLELSADPEFRKVVSHRQVLLSARSDWTCRVLVAGLQPDRPYWYRFVHEDGSGSRIGRTRTAPADHDARTARFAFVSCQNLNLGSMAAWRRMLMDDAASPEKERIDFVLHLGDFVYDTMFYPEDRPSYFDRTPRRVATYPSGERHSDFYVPTTVEDYRALYRAYLGDEALQDARARWPFVAIWDNGEFSNEGWQGLQRFGSTTRPAQTRKVAANQAWFEYIPARLGHGALDFVAPDVSDQPVTTFDARTGLGIEPNNLAAINSLIGYRRFRWGAHVELMLTDQRSFRSEDYTAAPEAKNLADDRFPQMVPFETLQAIDGGREANGGRPSPSLQLSTREIPNFCKDKPVRTLLGEPQKRWLLGSLGSSTATWKIWADTVASFDMRADPQNLPPPLGHEWKGAGFAGFPRTDHSTTYTERTEILDHVRTQKIGGFAILSGDRHSFWAGYAARALPPEGFEPVGLNFVVASISSPGMVEAFEHTLAKQHPLRTLFLADGPGGTRPAPTVNLLLRHGVKSCLEYARTGKLEDARAASNPDNAPHTEFVDMGGHGYGVVSASPAKLDVSFVCIARPVVQNGGHDGGTLLYRVTHSADLWQTGSRPRLVRTSVTGDLGLSA